MLARAPRRSTLLQGDQPSAKQGLPEAPRRARDAALTTARAHSRVLRVRGAERCSRGAAPASTSSLVAARRRATARPRVTEAAAPPVPVLATRPVAFTFSTSSWRIP